MILCVGELMWDLHVEPDGTLETGERLRRIPGGAAANVALGLAARGIEAAVGGAVSDDALGHGLCQALERRGVATSAVKRRPGRTGLVFLERTASAAERYVSYRPALQEPACHELPERARVLCLSGPDPDEAAIDALGVMAAAARARGAWVLLDVNARPMPWRNARPAAAGAVLRLARQADAVKLSEGDLRVLSAHLGPHLGQAPEAALRQTDATVLITRGAAPTEAAGAWGSLALRPLDATVVRSIGAGDAFCAGLLAHVYRCGAPRAQSDWLAAIEEAHASARARITSAW